MYKVLLLATIIVAIIEVNNTITIFINIIDSIVFVTTEASVLTVGKKLILRVKSMNNELFS
jgi:hypothetical protein